MPKKEDDGGVVTQLPKSYMEACIHFALSEEIEWKVQPDEEVESPDIMKKMPYVISLVANGRRKVVGTIALDVVMLHVMVEVTVPSMAH
jgi:hypothetical protein